MKRLTILVLALITLFGMATVTFAEETKTADVKSSVPAKTAPMPMKAVVKTPTKKAAKNTPKTVQTQTPAAAANCAACPACATK